MPEPTSRRFRVALLVILVVAAGVRTAFILGVARNDHHFYDAAYYELQARAIVDGHGYSDPFQFLPGHSHEARPAADHPPLTVFAILPVVAAGDGLGASASSTRLLVRFEMLLVGLVGIVLMALLARRLAGDLAGLIAASLAALYANLWVNDGLIMSESLAVVVVVGALLMLFRLIDSRQLPVAFALGTLCGVAALARAELILLAPLFAIPLLATWRDAPWRDRLVPVVVVAAGTVLVVGPWVGFNLSRFHDPTFISTNDGIAILGSTCEPVFSGPAIGLTDLTDCIPEHAPPGDQSVVSRIYRQRAWDYVTNGREGRFVTVLLARIGRDWSVFRPFDMRDFGRGEGRPSWVTTLGLWWYYPLVVLAIAAAVWLRRRRVRIWPLLVPPVVVTAGAVLSYGQTRLRVPAEPVIVVLAGCAIAGLTGRATPAPRDDRSPSPPGAAA